MARDASLVGRSQGPFVRSFREATCDAGGRSSDRLRKLRRRYTGGRIWRRHRDGVGQGYLGARSERRERCFAKGRFEVHPARKKTKRLVGAGADAWLRTQLR